MRGLCPLISPGPGRFDPHWLLHCTEPDYRNYNTSVVGSCPSPVHRVYTAAHKGTLWAQKEDDDVGHLLRCPVSLESTWFVERCVCRPATQVPVFLHERCVYRSWSHSIHSDLARAILLGSGLGQPYHPVLAGIICGVAREP